MNGNKQINCGLDITGVTSRRYSRHHGQREDKKRIFTFRTPWGLYRYVRLPSGVNCASAECNNNLRAILEGLPGIVQIADDVVCFGKGKEHDKRLEMLLARLRKWGITLRKEKCQWGQPEVLWFGKIYSKQGVSIDPAKTEVIKNLPEPQTAKGPSQI